MTCTTRVYASSPCPTVWRCHFGSNWSRHRSPGRGQALWPWPRGRDRRQLPGEGNDAPEEGIAVPVGGGKDSIVLIEALKAASPLLSSRRGWSRSTRDLPCCALRTTPDCRSPR